MRGSIGTMLFISVIAVVLAASLWVQARRRARNDKMSTTSVLAVPAAAGPEVDRPGPQRADESVQFTVYRPKDLEPNVWQPFLAFAHLAERPPHAPADQPEPVEVVRQQAVALLGGSIEHYKPLTQDAAHAVPTDGELTFVPEVEGLEFDPPQRNFHWRGAVHREDFLVRADARAAGRLLRGRLAVFLGHLLIADVPLCIRVKTTAKARGGGEAMVTGALVTESAPRYRRIFASYCHQDSAIVEEIERYARVLGDEYLRDVTTLRSGEVWGERLEALIDAADVFQLFWSWSSLDSPFVRREWEHALQLGRPGFIRPVYWEEPLPSRPEQDLPPAALNQLHFQRLPVRSRRPDSATDALNLTLEIVSPNGSALGLARRKVFGPEGGSIGRSPESTWVLSSAYISRRHATVFRNAAGFFIHARGDKPVAINHPQALLPAGSAHLIRSGDRLYLEDYEILATVGTAPAASASPSLPDAWGPAPGKMPAIDPFDVGAAAPQCAGPSTSRFLPPPASPPSKGIARERTPLAPAASIAAADSSPVPEGLLEVLEVAATNGPARIELHHGDLTRMSGDNAVDVLVVSSFPNSYDPTAGSLIQALEQKGVSVASLAADKYVDLRAAFSCWLSQEIRSVDPGIHFTRILCFESLYRGVGAPEAVGDIFRALAPFVAGEPRLSSIAMPVLATGFQGYSVAEVLPPLLDSAVEWLKVGLPIRKIAIVAHSAAQAREARKFFALARQRHAQDVPPRATKPQYDAFVSYAREDESAAMAIANHLQQHKLQVFVDRLELSHGTAWQQHLFEALDASKKVVAIYSPSYVRSKVCQEEFNIAWARGRKLSSTILFPVYWQSSELPTYMEMLQYWDCREQADARLDLACQTLVTSLKGP